VNVFKTYFLLATLTAILVAFGYMLDRIMGTGSMMMMIFLVIGIATNWISYFYSDKIVLKMYRAQVVTPEEAPELHEIVDRVARAAKIPKPKVCIIPTDVPNAFATGRNPERGVVACTNGIMRALSWKELEGVIAHEIGHIRNRDTLVQTVAATLAGAIAMAAHMGHFGMIFGGRGGSREGGNPVALILTLVLIIFAPIMAMLVQMAISRTREYGADRAGAEFTGNPDGLATALEKIQSFASRYPMQATNGTQHLFIVNPLSGAKAMSWFSTHPPTEERVARLREMSRDMMTGKFRSPQTTGDTR
jgi:heat shock protein HtpX